MIQSPFTLNPDYKVPGGLFLIACGVALIWPWVGLGMGVFALFLASQAATIRLVFTEQALEVLRSGKRVVFFPYTDWITWRIFWPGFPIVFFFREVKSIHLIPMLFRRTELEAGLKHFVDQVHP